MTFEYVEVTPALAARWLEGKVHNRSIAERHVERLARDMRAGKWLRNGDTIKFNPDGQLIDGQHRLWSVIYADLSVWLDVARNVPDEALLTIDTNRLRTFANHLQMTRPGLGDSTSAASVVRWWLYYETLLESSAPIMAYNTMRATHSELDACLTRHPEILIAVEEVSRSHAARIITRSVIGFVMSGALLDDAPKARAFLEQVAKGISLTNDSPTYRLRERFINMRAESRRIEPIEQCAITMKAWLAFAHGRSMKALRYADGEAFPRFLHSARSGSVPRP